MEEKKPDEKILKMQYDELEAKGSSERANFASVLIALAFAVIGFQIKFLVEGTYYLATNEPNDLGSVQFTYFASLLLFAGSPILGLISNFAKLLRLRYDAIELKKQLEKEPQKAIKKFNRVWKDLKDFAWYCFAFQVLTFALGCLMLGAFYFWRYIA
jgi:hypothetical protein